jgi:predicted ATPase
VDNGILLGLAFARPPRSGTCTEPHGAGSGERIEQPHSLAVTLHQSCVFHQLRADVCEVEEQCAELIALTEEQGYAHWLATGTIFRGWCIAVRARGAINESTARQVPSRRLAFWCTCGAVISPRVLRGERDRGLAEMRRGLAAKQATGAELKVPYYLGLLAALSGESGEEDATLLFADALHRIERTGERWFEAELHRLGGEVFQGGAEPSFDEAEVEFQRALAIAREQEAKFWELRAATSLARLWSDQRRNEDARNLLAPVYNWFTEGLGTPDLKEAKALLDELTSVGQRA